MIIQTILALYVSIALWHVYYYMTSSDVQAEIRKSDRPEWQACLIVAMVVIVCAAVWPYMHYQDWAGDIDEDEY